VAARSPLLADCRRAGQPENMRCHSAERQAQSYCRLQLRSYSSRALRGCRSSVPLSSHAERAQQRTSSSCWAESARLYDSRLSTTLRLDAVAPRRCVFKTPNYLKSHDAATSTLAMSPRANVVVCKLRGSCDEARGHGGSASAQSFAGGPPRFCEFNTPITSSFNILPAERLA
jgi:hypothetical protein